MVVGVGVNVGVKVLVGVNVGVGVTVRVGVGVNPEQAAGSESIISTPLYMSVLEAPV